MIAINVDITLAQIAMAQARWNEAATLLQSAIRRSVSAGMVTGEAVAQAQLAICETRRGHAGDRDKAATRARELRSRITEHMEVLGVDIALPQLALDTAQREAATATLRELAGDAARRGWLAWSLEARLALLQLLEQGRDSSAIEVRNRLAADAHAHGFAWILARMGATPAASPPT
jgi:hypothetical protein